MAGGADPALVEDDQLLGDLPGGGSDPALGLLPLAAPEAVQGGRLPAGVVADGVDLVGGDVELVAAPVLDQQVVALDPADGPLDHAAVAPDPVLDVDDEVAGLQVGEEAGRVPGPGAGDPVGPAPAGHVLLADHGEAAGREDAAPLEAGHDHVATGGRRVAAPLEADPFVAERLGHPGGRALAVGGQDDAVALGEELAELGHHALGAAHHRVEPVGLDGRGVGPVGGVGDGQDRRRRMGEQAVEGQVQAEGRRRAVRGGCRVGAPRAGQHAGQVGLLGQQVGGPVPHAAGLDEHDPGVGRDEVEQHVLLGREPGQPRLHAVEHLALGQALPVLPTPGLAAHEGRRPLPHRLRRQQLPAGEDLDALDVVPAALVAHAEPGQAVDLVAPEVDADRGVGRARVHVDDRAPHGDLAPVLDLVLPPVARPHQAGHEVARVEHVAGPDRDRLDVLDVRAQPLHEGPHRRHHDGRLVVAEPPHRAQAPAHGLGGGADPLEGQGLPRREQLHLVGPEVRLEVGDEPLGVTRRRRRHHQRPAVREGRRGRPASGRGPAPARPRSRRAGRPRRRGRVPDGGAGAASEGS